MSDESKLSLVAKADIAALVAWQKEVAAADSATKSLIATMVMFNAVARGGGGGGGPAGGAGAAPTGGGAATGAPPPTPAPAGGGAPQGGGGAATGAPPPAPTPAAHGAPPTSSGGGAAAGAPPPAPTSGGAATGAPPPPPPAPGISGGPATRPVPFTDIFEEKEKKKKQHYPYAPMPGADLARGAGSFLSNTASTALGVGLGTSLFGLPMAAINRYMTLSTVLEQVGRKFRDATDGAELFGTSMGYGIARSAMLSESLGKVRNSFSRGEAVNIAGLARFTGADPSSVLTAFGRQGTLQARSTSDADLAYVLRQAKTQGMDQGRFEEFLGRFESLISAQFSATGRVSQPGMQGALALPGLVYGPNDPRRSDDTTLVSGLHSTLTGGGPMASYMMRAMGYGRDGGMDYISMRKRLDAGVYDPNNVIDLFQSFQDRGMGRGAQFRAIESVAGGALKANQIEALVDSLGTKSGLDAFRTAAGEGRAGEALSEFAGTLSKEELAAFEKGGFTGLGKRSISAGESYENRIEAIMLKVGGELSQGIPNIQDTIESLGRTLTTVIGGDIGGKIEKITGLVERLALALERNSAPWWEGGVTENAAVSVGRMSGPIHDTWVKTLGAGRADGVMAGLRAGAEAGAEFWGIDQVLPTLQGVGRSPYGMGAGSGGR